MGGRGSSAGAGSAAFERKNFGKSNVSFKETEAQYRVKMSGGTEVINKAIGKRGFQGSTRKYGKDADGNNILITTGKYVGSKGNKYTVKERYWENPRIGGRLSKTDTVVRKGW